MKLETVLLGNRYKFSSIKEVLAKANEQKSGDSLAGIAAANAKERIAAKEVLSDLTVEEITAEPAVPANEDAVTRIILGDLDTKEYDKIKSLTIGELREAILDNMISGDEILKKARGMTSEVIAALAKLMGNLDLMYVSRKLHIEATCNTTIGKKGTFAVRLQPNHPTDNVKGVTASLLEGLSYGAGDAVLGLNPAIDNVKSTTDILNLFNDVKSRLKIPTQICVLSHITTQLKALKSGAPMDLCFQSIAGSEKALASFGTDVDMLAEANELMASKGTSIGPNYMYFETGQGSELSSNSHNGADQLVMESRCYGLARHYNPFLVNTVVGFIGPEYIYDTKELIRAALRAAHAAANDAVMSEVSKETLDDLGVFEVRTKCHDKYEMLTRPDYGRLFDEETKDFLLKNATYGADVQIYCGDGLSAPSIKANVPNMLPILHLGLEEEGISVGKPFFVRYCRVNTAREIGPLLNAKVVCVLIGERPGLLTDESMSAYIAYKPHPEMSESDYTVISNISRFGMPPVEAAAYAVDVIKAMLEQKCSGYKLKL